MTMTKRRREMVLHWLDSGYTYAEIKPLLPSTPDSELKALIAEWRRNNR